MRGGTCQSGGIGQNSNPAETTLSKVPVHDQPCAGTCSCINNAKELLCRTDYFLLPLLWHEDSPHTNCGCCNAEVAHTSLISQPEPQSDVCGRKRVSWLSSQKLLDSLLTAESIGNIHMLAWQHSWAP